MLNLQSPPTQLVGWVGVRCVQHFFPAHPQIHTFAVFSDFKAIQAVMKVYCVMINAAVGATVP